MKNNSDFQLFLCTSDIELIKSSQEADIDGIIVEWEQIENRDQKPIDAQLIKSEFSRIFEKVRNNTDSYLVCRLNPDHKHKNLELETAITLGAEEVWLPKIVTIEEVKRALDQINGRCHLGVVVETTEILPLIEELNLLPLSRVHIGLNDLRDALRKRHSFHALIDGTVENVIQQLTIPCGFGGLTLPGKGRPISSRLMMGEMTRLKCRFSLLRRSFIADTMGKNLEAEITKLRQGLDEAGSRTRMQIDADKQQFIQSVNEYC